MTAATQPPPTTHEPVICGHRETRPDGNYECVRPPGHDGLACYWVRLTTRGRV